MFYEQWAPSGENSVLKPRGTFIPKWEDIQSDLEPNLRELLSRKKKWKEAPSIESDDTPKCVRSEALMARLCTNCEGAWGPLVK